jgi:signal transduction histidine kinase/CheY-like chemotaxis protein
MLIDSYETPGAESLLRLGRERHAGRGEARRLVMTEAGGAAIFLAAGGALAAFGSSARSFSFWALAAMVVTYLIAGRVQYPVGSAWTAPTQLVFVPMLFVLPTPWVPLIIAACSVADRMPQAARGHLEPTRLLARVGDSFYALGPALVLVLFGDQTFAWRHWPLFVLALAAQVAFDAGAGLSRTWFAEGVRPSGQRPMLWLYATDACLSCVGLLIAASAVRRPGLVLLALPLVGLIGLLARERRQRLEYSLALTSAYRRTATLLAQSQNLTQELQNQSEALRETNDELHEKARLLAQQNREIEVKNEEIELARRGLEEKAAQLALSSRYKSEFLANVSHELRTPLTSMLLLARLLSENETGSLAEREVEFARTIHSAGNDLLSLINDILDLSKVEAGRMELECAPVALSDVRADAERAFRHVAEEKGLSFEVEVDPSLPGTIISDRQRLAQILRNLLSNAFKFTPAGGVTLSIGSASETGASGTASLRGAAGAIVFTVSDTGVGIPEDKLSLIFDAFQQADGTTSRRYGGTGLGLSISRELARLLGGELQVESVLGEGSRFSLHVPITGRSADGAPDPAAPEQVSPVPVAPVGRAGAGDGGRAAADDRPVLVIEPDMEQVSAIVGRVQARGAKVIAAAETAAVVELVREHRPKGVLLGADARRLESALRELENQSDTRHVPVVGIGEPAGRLPALRLGAAAFVERPIEPAELERGLARIDALTETRKRLVALVGHEADPELVTDLLHGIEGVRMARVDPADAEVALRSGGFDLGVVVVGARDVDTVAFLRDVGADEVLRELPLIAYVEPQLTKGQRARLDALAKTAAIAVVDSPELLADRAALFLHLPEATLPRSVQTLLDDARHGEVTLHGKKVLIIDDDIRSGFALTSMLEQHGMKVVFAENGREGIERLEQHMNTDLVLLDIMMPEMDGYETSRAIRSMPRFEHLPIISLTAKAMTGDREKAIAAGASDYIAKPVDVDRLLAMMRAWLARD